MRNKSQFLLLFLLIFSSCYDEFNDTTEVVIIDEPQIFVDANLVGELSNLDGNKILEYEIKVNETTYQNTHGLINLQLDYVNELSQSIYIETDDGKDAFINMPLLRNDINYAEIFLFPDASNQLLDENNNTTISIDSYLDLILNKDHFSTTGSNNISVNHRILGDDRLIKQIGNRAYNESSVESVMDIVRAFNFEWITSQSSNLELKAGETASLIFSGISEFSGLSLFRYSEAEEYWIWVEDITSSNTNIQIREDGYYALAYHYPSIIAKSQLLMNMKPVAYQSLKIETENRRTRSVCQDNGDGKLDFIGSKIRKS